MAISNTFIKDPNSTLDYGFDWSQWLDSGEVIAGYIITTGCGITNVYSTSTTAGSVIVWLSDGTAGNRYSVACKITTSGSRIDERTIKIDVRDR
jgi:hypothetical protein